jgi:hypothetical protein
MKKIMSSSIEPFNSKSYLEIPKGMASDTIFARECNGIQCEDKLIHEHNFVPETIKKGNRIVQCITCSVRYCNICGKVLGEAQAHTEAS